MADRALTGCGVCGAPLSAPILDLGRQPLAERDTGKTYPLRVTRCTGCGLPQLDYLVERAQVFPPGHPYASGNSAALRRHFAALAEQLRPRLTPGALLVDIGANDGTLLRAFDHQGLRQVAVEPTGQIRKTSPGVHRYQEFFTTDTARRIREQHGPATVVTACNVLAHCADPHDFTSGVRHLLDDDSVFVTENHDWARVARDLQIDTVYHEHLRFFTPGALARLLEAHGLLLQAIEPIGTHGGSLRAYAAPDPTPGLHERATRALDTLHRLVADAADAGPVYGISAATRATPLIHAAALTALIDRVCETPGSEKIGTRIPGTTIPIVPDEHLILEQPPHALLFAWHLAGDIVPKLRAAGYRGRFIAPLPRPRILEE